MVILYVYGDSMRMSTNIYAEVYNWLLWMDIFNIGFIFIGPNTSYVVG